MEYKFEDIAYNSTAKKLPIEADKDCYIGLEHLDSDCLSITRWGAETAPIGEKLIMKKGDVLFGKRRAYQRKVGIAPFDGIFSAHGMVLRPKEEVIDKDFFPFFISSDQFMERAVRISVGGLSPTINWKDLKIQKFSLPTLEEQRELAKKLWSAYRLKESYKKLLAATSEMVKSQFIEMFGDVNSPKAPVYALGDICEIHRGGSPRPISKYITNDPDGLNWIKIGDADDTMFISKTAERIIPEGLNKTRKVFKGDLLLSNSMSFGHPYILNIDGCIHDGWLVLHFDHNRIHPIFLCKYLGLPSTYVEMSKLASGGVVLNLNSEIIKKLPVILPNSESQMDYLEIAEQADKSESECHLSIHDLINSINYN